MNLGQIVKVVDNSYSIEVSYYDESGFYKIINQSASPCGTMLNPLYDNFRVIAINKVLPGNGLFAIIQTGLNDTVIQNIVSGRIYFISERFLR